MKIETTSDRVKITTDMPVEVNGVVVNPSTLKPKVTVAWLEKEWPKHNSRFRLSGVSGEEFSYLYACRKSRWAADQIRSDEGLGDVRRWYIANNTGQFTSANILQFDYDIPGVEYFATEAGCKLWAEFLGEDLKLL